MIHAAHPTAAALVSFVIGGVFGASVTAILSPRRRGTTTRAARRVPAAGQASTGRVPEPGLPTTTSAYVTHA